MSLKRSALFAAVLLSIAVAPAAAQLNPSRTITLVVPIGAGGGHVASLGGVVPLLPSEVSPVWQVHLQVPCKMERDTATVTASGRREPAARRFDSEVPPNRRSPIGDPADGRQAP